MNKRQKLLVKWGLYFTAGMLALIGLAFFTEFGKDPAALNEDGSVEGLTSVLDREVDDKMKQFSFAEIAKQAGIDFKHFPAQRQSLLPEDMGSGVAWGDYNNDGFVDYF